MVRMEWTNTRNKMPRDNEPVVVALHSGLVSVGYWNMEKESWLISGVVTSFELTKNEVVAWLSLPEFPRDKEY